MTEFARCINNDYVSKELTIDKLYKVYTSDSDMILIEDDTNTKIYYNIDRFSIQEYSDDYLLNRKLNALKDLVLFLANKQTTKDLEEYEVLKNLINEVEEKFN